LKNIAAIPAVSLALLLSATAFAQTTVYETRDAEGNVSFSDESSPDSREVDIQETSVADAPQPMPEEQEEEQEPTRGEQRPSDSGEYEPEQEPVYGDDGEYLYDDPRLRREAVRDHRDETIPGESAAHDRERAAEGSLGVEGGDAGRRADEAAERSDITGPNAEYRNTERAQPHQGERR
jgi:hypothetical protein